MLRTSRLALTVSLAALTSVLTASSAFADTTCTTTKDCLLGELCNEVPQVCDALCMGFLDGGYYCPPCDTGPATYECAPGAACTSNADCNADLTCVSGGTCQPRAGQPCSTDNDCGANYQCQLSEECSGGSASGGGATGGSGGASSWSTSSDGTGSGGGYNTGTTSVSARSGGTSGKSTTYETTVQKGAPLPAEVDASVSPPPTALDGGPAPKPVPVSPPVVIDAGYSCSVGTTGYCAAKTMTCVGSTDCPANWSCEQTEGIGVGCAVAPGSDATCDAGPQPPQPPMQCVSPYGGYGYAVPGTSEGVGSGGAGGSGSMPSGAGGSVGVTATETFGSSAGTTSKRGATSGTGAGNGATDTSKGAPASEDTSTSASGSGCQVGAGSTDASGWLSTIGLVAIALGFRRGRRRD
jgi:hypothetical protein